MNRSNPLDHLFGAMKGGLDDAGLKPDDVDGLVPESVRQEHPCTGICSLQEHQVVG